MADVDAHQAQYRKVDSDLMDYSTEGGMSSRYYDGKVLMNADVLLFGEIGKTEPSTDGQLNSLLSGLYGVLTKADQ